MWYTFLALWNGKLCDIFFFASLHEHNQVDCVVLFARHFSLSIFFDTFSSPPNWIQIRTNLNIIYIWSDYITHEVVWLSRLGLFGDVCFTSFLFFAFFFSASKISAQTDRDRDDWQSMSLLKIIKHKTVALFAWTSSSSFDIHSSKLFVRYKMLCFLRLDVIRLLFLKITYTQRTELRVVLVDSLFSNFPNFLGFTSLLLLSVGQQHARVMKLHSGWL